MAVVPNEAPWHLATNFLASAAGETLLGRRDRYDPLFATLAATNVSLDPNTSLGALAEASQEGSTQWSIVYGLSDGTVRVAMGRHYDQVHSFALSAGDE